MKKLLLLPILLCLGQLATAQTQKEVQGPWPDVQAQTKPWTRWWWMGNAVDAKNLDIALTTYEKAGLGGVEITPIYGAKGFESRYIDYLSPQWMKMLDFTVQKAKSLGMGVDMNTGTGWPFGGPQVTPEFAASKSIVQQYKVSKGQRLPEAIVLQDQKQDRATAVLQAVTAYGPNGEVINLLDKVDAAGKLDWIAKNGNYEVWALFSGKTLQKVKRAAPGGEGYTLDHLDKPAVNAYLKRFDAAFGTSIPGVRAFFNDSYEVYNANWTPSFLAEFKKIKGYDLSLHLKDLFGKDTTSTTVGRVKSDYRETMSHLLLVNFTKNWTDWSHGHKGISKNQSHGSPGNLLDLYAAVDIPETETFGSSYFAIPGLRRDSADIRNVDPDPIMNKFASSAAHTSGKPLVSSETFTWLTEHFKTSFSQAKPEAEQLFLSGINHLFYHGTTFTPADVPFPGWLFYASLNMVPANSLWPHSIGMNTYFTRCQSILQAGSSDNELLIYWPVYDQWGRAKGMDMPMKVHDIDVWLHPTPFYKESLKLQDAGYAFDYASDLVLSQTKSIEGSLQTNAKASPYKTLIIPESKLMPLQTLQNIVALAQAGATVIFQKLPEDVPGLSNLEQDRKEFKQVLNKLKFVEQAAGVQEFKIGTGIIYLAANLQEALTLKNIHGESLVKSGLQFIRRKSGEQKYYYLVNHTAKTIDQWIPIHHKGSSTVILDPLNGEYGNALTREQDGEKQVKIYLEPGETLFLQSGNQPRLQKDWLYLGQPGSKIGLNGKWDLQFTNGGPKLPSSKTLEKLVSWTELNDPETEAFSGTGLYTQSFQLKKKSDKEYVLNLGQVDESAKVWINGKEVGVVWSIPFKVRIGKYLVPGKNTIKVEVANLMANHIRYMDQHHMPWRNYHEINFVNINYKEFDASKWAPMPSGLLGPVEITGYK